MRLRHRSAFLALGAVATVAGGIYVALAVGRIRRGSPDGHPLLAFGIVALALGAALTWLAGRAGGD